MAWTLLLALAFAATASGARYGDYTAVKMPQYGGNDYDSVQEGGSAEAAADYHDRSPDAPASLDYKYEEEPNRKNEKSALKELDETDVWQKRAKSQKGHLQSDDEDNLDLDKYNAGEIAPKVKSNYKFTKHRPRHKRRHHDESGEVTYRGLVNKHNRNRKEDIRNIDMKNDFHLDKKDFLDETSTDFEDDKHFFSHRETTRKIARRKPRDRFVKVLDSEENDDEEYEDSRSRKEEVRTNPEYSAANEAHRRRPTTVNVKYHPIDDEGEDEVLPPSTVKQKKKKKDPNEYNDDYYDMKRVYSIRNKFPNLLRRTSARIAASTPRSEYIEALPTRRRAHLLEQHLGSDPMKTTMMITAIYQTPSIPSTTTVSTTTVAASIITTSLQQMQTKGNSSSDLSIAEKSRLSIFRKAQRKENVRNDTSTKKPPVLLQVTNKMHTLVMVEPPIAQLPWDRVREVADDTPENINKVKQLMRHKLVANAKDIRELTDNWDDVVCDYVDMELISRNSGRVHTCFPLDFISLTVFLLLYA